MVKIQAEMTALAHAAERATAAVAYSVDKDDAVQRLSKLTTRMQLLQQVRAACMDTQQGRIGWLLHVRCCTSTIMLPQGVGQEYVYMSWMHLLEVSGNSTLR